MTILSKNTGLYTDYYELTMAQGYFLTGWQNTKASFDYFFRKNPYGGGFVIFSGLVNLLEVIENYSFQKDDCEFLENLGFDRQFVEYLEDFRFEGNIFSVKEGEVVFPDEPIVRVEGNIIACQLIESLLLNTLNFQSLIATKAARMRQVAGEKLLFDFGMRRAQGLGAIHASRAAIIGGFNSTSNVFSAYNFGLKSGGTMAHSWIQSFNSELEAFREFVRYYPDSSVLLVDTFNSIKSGIPNAVKIAKEMEDKGYKLIGIRLDSGDLAYLSKLARKMLDEADLKYVKIVVSNQLDEIIIKSLIEQKAPIDAFGVGTALATGKGEGALDGVYKLAQIDNNPTMKVSENISKMTLPGRKTIYKFYNPSENFFYADGIELEADKVPPIIYHIQHPEIRSELNSLDYEKIIHKVMENGKVLSKEQDPVIISDFVKDRLNKLPSEMKRFENPHVFKVGLGKKLLELRNHLKKEVWTH